MTSLSRPLGTFSKSYSVRIVTFFQTRRKRQISNSSLKHQAKIHNFLSTPNTAGRARAESISPRARARRGKAPLNPLASRIHTHARAHAHASVKFLNPFQAAPPLVIQTNLPRPESMIVDARARAPTNKARRSPQRCVTIAHRDALCVITVCITYAPTPYLRSRCSCAQAE